jgi:hypothetical protein
VSFCRITNDYLISAYVPYSTIVDNNQLILIAFARRIIRPSAHFFLRVIAGSGYRSSGGAELGWNLDNDDSKSACLVRTRNPTQCAFLPAPRSVQLPDQPETEDDAAEIGCECRADRAARPFREVVPGTAPEYPRPRIVLGGADLLVTRVAQLVG